MHSENWRTIAVQYETSVSGTYVSSNNELCPNLCNSKEECKIPQQHEKHLEIVIKDENVTVLSSPQG